MCDAECTTHVYDGVEGGRSHMRTDGREDGFADLSDESTGLRQQGKQDVNHHLHPLGFLLLLLCGSNQENTQTRGFLAARRDFNDN